MRERERVRKGSPEASQDNIHELMTSYYYTKPPHCISLFPSLSMPEEEKGTANIDALPLSTPSPTECFDQKSDKAETAVHGEKGDGMKLEEKRKVDEKKKERIEYEPFDDFESISTSKSNDDVLGVETKLAMGVSYTIFKRGQGEKATQGRTLNVNFRGWLTCNGREVAKGRFQFRVGCGDVIEGWDIGIVGKGNSFVYVYVCVCVCGF